ncbi:hypothetical protein D3C77_357340 [compost metagenome]
MVLSWELKFDTNASCVAGKVSASAAATSVVPSKKVVRGVPNRETHNNKDKARLINLNILLLLKRNR